MCCLHRCWDVRSVAHTRAVSALASELLVYVPPDEERIVELLSVVRGSLEAAAEACSVPPWPPAAVSCAPAAAAVLFRRFRHAARLLHSVSAFEGLLSRGLLVGLALGRVVCGQMLPYCRAAGAEMGFAVSCVEAIAAGLHPDWFVAGPPPEAGPFCDHVASLSRALEQQRADAARAPLAVRVARVLARLGEAERSKRLLAAFGLRS